MKSALLVIDAQKIYTSPDSEMKCEDSSATIGRINKLIKKFETLGIPIFYVRHIHKKNGSDTGRLFDYTGEKPDSFNFKEGTDEVKYDENLILVDKRKEIKKNRYNAFTNTSLNKSLSELKIKRVIICGFMTNFCCESTVRGAHDLDYYVDFIVDATGTPGTETINEKKMRKIVGELLSEGFANVYKTNEYLKSI